MIFDTMKNIDCYRSLSSNMDRAIETLLSTDFSALSAGRYEVDGNNVYFMVQEPQLKEEENALYEVHRKYADIQLALTDGEVILALPIDQIDEWQDFDDVRDIGFSVNAEPGMPLDMKPGCFAIFFPQDAHMPCLRGGDEKNCRKVVVKVKL